MSEIKNVGWGPGWHWTNTFKRSCLTPLHFKGLSVYNERMNSRLEMCWECLSHRDWTCGAVVKCRQSVRQPGLELPTAAVAKDSVAMAISVTALSAENSPLLLSCHHSINFIRFLLRLRPLHAFVILADISSIVDFQWNVMSQVGEPWNYTCFVEPWPVFLSLSCSAAVSLTSFTKLRLLLSLLLMRSIFTVRAYASGLGSRNSVRVCLAHACIVTKLNDTLRIFWCPTKGQSFCYSDINNGLVGNAPSVWNMRSNWPTPFEKRRLRQIFAYNVSTV